MGSEKSKGKMIPIADGYFTWPSDEPRLIGTRCRACNSYCFPKSPICQNPTCRHKDDVEEVLLSKTGKLWSYTFQYYQPPPPYQGPEPFVPFGIGLVELPEGLMVLGALTNCRLEDLKVGLDVRLVIEKMYEDTEGNEYLTWKFSPKA